MDEVEAFRSKVNDGVAVIDSLDDHKQTWLEQTSCLKAQTARFDTAAFCSLHTQRSSANLPCFMTGFVIRTSVF